jgi:SNF2 family DNA or RNA helicase
MLGRLFGKREEVVERLKNRDKLKRLLQGRVDYHPSSGAFPGVEDEHIDVDMTPQQSEVYNGLLNAFPLSYKIRRNLPPSRKESRQINAFMAAVRQVSNNPRSYDMRLRELPGDDVDHSPKMTRMVEEIKKRMDDPDFRGVVYSNYLDSGIMPVARKLSSLGIPNAVFTGEIGDRERARIVDAYNKGDLRVLLISGAGAEGLNLRGTQLIQLMEPHWNNPRLDQVIGRGVRYGSHSHLPKEKQKVTVQRFFAKPQPSLLQRFGLVPKDTGSDRYLHNLAMRKQQIIDQVQEVLKEVGSEPQGL